ncbi:hypothetical protein V2J09_004274 [Rumex salicifolius]
MNLRRHGWQRPLHPLQMLGMTIYLFLVASFYCFNGLFLGNKVAEITVCSAFGFVAAGVMFLFIRCVALDPTDKTRLRRKKKGKSKGFSKLNYGFMLRQLFARTVRRIEQRILKTWIRRKYLSPMPQNVHHSEPLLLFPPFVTEEDMVAPDPKEEDVSFCSLCDFEVKMHSKHCRTCNRCVEGFDHHCKWLNNCVGKKNYTTFILLMVFVLLLLTIEGGSAIAIFVRCFADKKGMEQELARRHFVTFPRGVLAAIAVLLVVMIAYGLAALGQLFFFHLVLIQKGLRTYEYILAMKDNSKFHELDESDWSSDDSFEFEESPTRPIAVASKFVCSGEDPNQSPGRLTIKIDPEAEAANSNKRQNLSPWRLLKMSQSRALEVADRAKEMLVNQKTPIRNVSLYPMPFEMKNGPMMINSDTLTSLAKFPGSPRFSSPRRRVSRELESHISRHVLRPVFKDEDDTSPR